MGLTPIYGFPYPSGTDSPNGPAQVQLLAEAVEADLAASDANIAALQAGAWSGWTAYTPTFTMQTSNGTKTGWYNKVGKRVEVNVAMLATSGVSLGTGVITVSLPFAAANRVNHMWEGVGMFITASHTILRIEVQPGASVAEIWAIDAVNHSLGTPGNFGYGFVAGNRITASFSYEAA